MNGSKNRQDDTVIHQGKDTTLTKQVHENSCETAAQETSSHTTCGVEFEKKKKKTLDDPKAESTHGDFPNRCLVIRVADD